MRALMVPSGAPSFCAISVCVMPEKKAMLTASNGYGGKLYRIVACLLVYFTVNCGKLLLPVLSGYHRGLPIPVPTVLAYVFFGPILRLQTGLYGILGLLVLGYGLRMAWRMGKGTRTA